MASGTGARAPRTGLVCSVSNLDTPSIVNITDNRPFRIAVIAGDGIGQEVMPEGLRVLQAAAERFDLSLEFRHFDWAHCDYYLKTGSMMPPDWKALLDEQDVAWLVDVLLEGYPTP